MKKIYNSDYYYIDNLNDYDIDTFPLAHIDRDLYNKNVVAIEGYIESDNDILNDENFKYWCTELCEHDKDKYYFFKIINHIKYIEFTNMGLKSRNGESNGRYMEWI